LSADVRRTPLVRAASGSVAFGLSEAPTPPRSAAVNLLPLTAFNDALRHVVNDDASIFMRGFPLAVLVGWGVMTTALRTFRWT
jgi:hypothetical protein